MTDIELECRKAWAEVEISWVPMTSVEKECIIHA